MYSSFVFVVVGPFFFFAVVKEMEELARLLQQAECGVLSAQEDLLTLRTRAGDNDADNGGSFIGGVATVSSGAVANPYYVDLHTTIQQKQEAVTKLLLQGSRVLRDQLAEAEEKAQALGNIKSKEKELRTAKKTMQRYFDCHRKLLEEQKDVYEDLVLREQHKVDHLYTITANVLHSTSQRKLQRAVLTKWLKRSMVRDFHRHEATVQRGVAQAMEDMAERFVRLKRNDRTKAKLLHFWQRRTNSRQQRRLENEVRAADRDVVVFQQQSAAAQRMLAHHLDAAQAKTQLCERTKSRQCELLDDEMEHLKGALEEVTGEFSERTRTYVRQQEETEQFFLRKEQKLKDAVVQLQTEVEHYRSRVGQLSTDAALFGYSTLKHTSDAELLFLEVSAKKEALFVGALAGVASRLHSRNADLTEEVAKLTEDVQLLAPLSTKVVHVENELTTASALLARETKERHRLALQLQQSETVQSVLTDRVERCGHNQLRGHYFWQWMQWSSGRLRRVAETEVTELRTAQKERQTQFLLQQQRTSAFHREEKEALTDELARSKQQCTRLQQELTTALEQLRGKESELYDSQVDNGIATAQLHRERHASAGAFEELAATQVRHLATQEELARSRVEQQEVVSRGLVGRRELDVWQEDANTLRRDVENLTAMCDGWRDHCEEREAAASQWKSNRTAMTASVLHDLHKQGDLRLSFLEWKAFARQKRALAQVSQLHEEERDAVVQHMQAVQEAKWRAFVLDRETTEAHLTRAHQDTLRDLQTAHAQEMQQLRDACDGEKSEVAAQVHAMEADLRAADAQLESAGVLVVEYCARSAFSLWQGWLQKQKAKRQALQQRYLGHQIRTWCDDYRRLVVRATEEQEDAFVDAVREAGRQHDKQQTRHCTELEAERDRLVASIAQLTIAGEAMAESGDQLRDENRRLKEQYDAEKAWTASLQGQLIQVKELREKERADFQDLVALDKAGGQLTTAHLLAVSTEYETRLTALLREAGPQSSLRGRPASPCTPPSVKSEELSPIISADSVRSKQSPAMSVDDVEEIGEGSVLPTTADEKCSMAAPALLFSKSVREWLQQLQVNANAETGEATDVEAVRALLQRPLASLHQVRCLNTKDENEEDCPGGDTTPVSAPPSLVAQAQEAVEAVRSAALSALNAQAQRLAREAAVFKEQLQSNEETLNELHDAMEQLLREQHATAEETQEQAEEQVSVAEQETQTPALPEDMWHQRLRVIVSYFSRSLKDFDPVVAAASNDKVSQSAEDVIAATESMAEHLFQRAEQSAAELAEVKAALLAAHKAPTVTASTSPPPPVATADEEAQTDEPFFDAEAWEEQLHTVADLYSDVLRGYLREAEEQLDSFAVSARLLSEADSFADDLLDRFNDQLTALEALKERAVAAAVGTPMALDSAVAATPRMAHSALAGEGKADEPPAGDLVSTPPPRGPPPPAESEVPDDASESLSSLTSADRSTVSHQHSSSEVQQLRDRVGVLEQLLVQAKVQLAEARELAATAARAVSIPALRPPQSPPASLPPLSGEVSRDGVVVSGEAQALMETLRQVKEQMRREREHYVMELNETCRQIEDDVREEYREELARCAAREAALQTALDAANHNHEVEKMKWSRNAEALARQAMESEEQAQHTLQQVKANYQAELDDLTSEVALLQDELDEAKKSAASASELAVSRETELQSQEYRRRVDALERDLHQLHLEKQALQQRKEEADAEWTAQLEEERHTRECLAVEYDSQLQELERQCEDCAAEMRQQHAEQRALQSLLGLTSDHRERLSSLFSDACEEKVSFVIETAQVHLWQQQLRTPSGAWQAVGGGAVCTSTDLDEYLFRVDVYTEDALALIQDYTLAQLELAQEVIPPLMSELTEQQWRGTVEAIRLEKAREVEEIQTQAQYEREGLETTNMQLTEQIAFLKSAAEAAPPLSASWPDGSLTVSATQPTVSPLPREVAEFTPAGGQQLSPEVAPVSPSDGTAAGPTSPSSARAVSHPSLLNTPPNTEAMRETSTSLPRRGLPRRVQNPVPIVAEASGPATPTKADSADTVEPRPPDASDCVSDTPVRARSRSLDSLELSQSMLRYSKLLSDQRDRNARRLCHADALAAEVSELMAQGERLAELARQEHFTPDRSSRRK